MSSGSPGTDEPWTVRRILDWTVNHLKERGSETPRLDAEVLLAHARNCRRIQLYTQFDEPLTDSQRGVMRDLVRRRAAAEPVAYLVGHREFFSLDFLVRPGVLIPRPDTETLVMAAIDLVRAQHVQNIADLGTGTACVPIALAKNLPDLRLTAVEIDPVAFAVARENIDRHHVADRIRLLSGDLLAPVPAGERFGLITSNPPYVPSGEIPELAADIRNHEPHRALDGGADGLDVIRRIIADAPERLEIGGWLLIEISPEQADAVRSLFEQRGFGETGVKADLGGTPRVVLGKWAGIE